MTRLMLNPEARFVALGMLDARLHALCFTPVAGGIRVISRGIQPPGAALNVLADLERRLNLLSPRSFPRKDPVEVVLLAFEFADEVGQAAIAAPVVTASVHAGTDAAPGALLAGSVTVSGSRVIQRLQGGLAGVTYRVRAQVDTSDGQRYVLAGLLPVRVA